MKISFPITVHTAEDMFAGAGFVVETSRSNGITTVKAWRGRAMFMLLFERGRKYARCYDEDARLRRIASVGDMVALLAPYSIPF